MSSLEAHGLNVSEGFRAALTVGGTYLTPPPPPPPCGGASTLSAIHRVMNPRQARGTSLPPHPSASGRQRGQFPASHHITVGREHCFINQIISRYSRRKEVWRDG